MSGVRIARVAGQGCESGRSGVMNSSMRVEECKKGIRVVDGNISGWRGVQMADQECKWQIRNARAVDGKCKSD